MQTVYRQLSSSTALSSHLACQRITSRSTSSRKARTFMQKQRRLSWNHQARRGSSCSIREADLEDRLRKEMISRRSLSTIISRSNIHKAQRYVSFPSCILDIVLKRRKVDSDRMPFSTYLHHFTSELLSLHLCPSVTQECAWLGGSCRRLRSYCFSAGHHGTYPGARQGDLGSSEVKFGQNGWGCPELAAVEKEYKKKTITEAVSLLNARTLSLSPGSLMTKLTG